MACSSQQQTVGLQPTGAKRACVLHNRVMRACISILAAALGLCACDLYHAAPGRPADAGADGSCASADARALPGSRHDPVRHCFEHKAALPNLCALERLSPGGGGEVTCFVSPDQDAYAVFVLYGERFTDPAWHVGDTSELASTLTDAQVPLCESLWKDYVGVEDLDAGAPVDDRALWAPLSAAEVVPACDRPSDLRR